MFKSPLFKEIVVLSKKRLLCSCSK